LVRALHRKGLAVIGDDVATPEDLPIWAESAAKKCVYVVVVISPETLMQPDSLVRLANVRRGRDRVVIPLWKDVGPESVNEVNTEVAASTP
jgi:hypothetical protein